MKKTKKQPFAYLISLWEYAKTNKVAYIIFIVLNAATIFTIINCIIDRRPDGVFIGIIALLMLLIPPFVKKSFRLKLPTVLEAVAYFFVFCAQVLGEINSYYTKIPFWDAMLHTVCGFIFAAFGFCLFDILNENRKIKFELSPLFLTLLAFCFSITIGTLWEFFEFGMDFITIGDMQKDTLIHNFGSVWLNEDGLNKNVYVTDIYKTEIYTKNGIVEIPGGYLDIGLYDTMKDMFVNFIGALVFSVFGFIYTKAKGKGKVAKQFIPVFITDEATNPTENTVDDEDTEPNTLNTEASDIQTEELTSERSNL